VAQLATSDTKCEYKSYSVGSIEVSLRKAASHDKHFLYVNVVYIMENTDIYLG
jgi:hypothetical protein